VEVSADQREFPGVELYVVAADGVAEEDVFAFGAQVGPDLVGEVGDGVSDRRSGLDRDSPQQRRVSRNRCCAKGLHVPDDSGRVVGGQSEPAA
jgi:hypothetical protein